MPRRYRHADDDDAEGRVAPELDGVPETALLTLWNRASFAKGASKVLNDVMALDLLGRIDFDFQRAFGKPYAAAAIRSRKFDEYVRRFLDKHPQGPIVALGEGLETQFWRVDNGRMHWYCLDLPEVLALRERLDLTHGRSTALPFSALDDAWLQAVPEQDTVFISAAGLFMYLRREDTQALMRKIVRRWPRGYLAFDTVPPWMSRWTSRGLKASWASPRTSPSDSSSSSAKAEETSESDGANYMLPPMPFALPLREVPDFLGDLGMRCVDVQAYAQPYPRFSPWPSRLLSSIPWWRGRLVAGLVLASWGESRRSHA